MRGGPDHHVRRGRGRPPWPGRCSMPSADGPGPAPVRGARSVYPVTGLGEVRPGDDLAELLAAAPRPRRGRARRVPAAWPTATCWWSPRRSCPRPRAGSCAIDPDDPEAKLALVESESVRIVRRRGDLLITETRARLRLRQRRRRPLQRRRRHGRAPPRRPRPLGPPDPRGARAPARVSVGVIVSDTFGRTWRTGVTDVAIGIAGIAGVVDLRGTADATGRVLEATEVCVADEVAGAAELVMGKDRGVPAAVVRGVDPRGCGRPRWPPRSSARRRGPLPLIARHSGTPRLRRSPRRAGPVGRPAQPTSKRSTTKTRVSFGADHPAGAPARRSRAGAGW